MKRGNLFFLLLASSVLRRKPGKDLLGKKYAIFPLDGNVMFSPFKKLEYYCAHYCMKKKEFKKHLRLEMGWDGEGWDGEGKDGEGWDGEGWDGE